MSRDLQGQEKPQDFKNDANNPKCSYFSVIDGHGGNNCANYLREKLHHLILNDQNFPEKCGDALKNGSINCEKEFLKTAIKKDGTVDRSGACALIALFKGKVRM